MWSYDFIWTNTKDIEISHSFVSERFLFFIGLKLGDNISENIRDAILLPVFKNFFFKIGIKNAYFYAYFLMQS